MRKTPLATMLLASALAGCTMIPDYLRPELPVAENWQSETPQELPDEAKKAAAEIAWQEFFQSPDLQKVIQTALDNNRDLRVAALNVEAARALYRVERSDLFPNVSAGAMGTRQKITEAQSAGNPLFGSTPREVITSTYSANLATTAFELDLFGRLRSQNEAALESYFASQAARDAAQISLIAEVANAYLQWLADRKILALTEETLAAQEKSFQLISKSYEKGVASKLDLSQVRQAVETAKASQALFTRRVAQDQNALLLLMGVKTLDPSMQEGQLDKVELMKHLPVGLPSDVLLARPDVRRAEHDLLSANANIGAARAAFFPTLSLTGTFGYASSDLDKLFSSGAAGAWSFIPQITMPIFQGGRNIANLDYAEVVKDASVARYEKAIQSAFKEVSDELAAYRTLESELEAQGRLVDASRESYDLSYARYKEGIDSFLNVLDAQRSLFSAQQQKIDIEKQRLANLVNLYKVLGGGLKDAKPEKEDKPEKTSE